MGKILITGATGNLGTATIDQLLKVTASENIVALAREESKAYDLRKKGVEVRIGDFEEPASLDKALKGIDKLLLISTIAPNRLDQHKNVVDAAKKSGVKHIVYTGVAMSDVKTSEFREMMETHYQTEDYIRDSGLAYTFLQNSLYTEVLVMYLGENVLETGIYFPAGNAKVAYALRREMGEATANMLVQEGHDNKTYLITGPQLYTFNDIAKALSDISGKEIAYVDADPKEFGAKLKELKVDDFFVGVINGFAADMKNGQYEIQTDDLERLLGRKPTELQQGLKEVFHF